MVLNHLDYAKIKIISPSGHIAHSESHRIDQMVCIATHRVRMNEVALNNTLTVHKKGFHSSFQSDFLLSQSGQAIGMPLFSCNSKFIQDFIEILMSIYVDQYLPFETAKCA